MQGWEDYEKRRKGEYDKAAWMPETDGDYVELISGIEMKAERAA